MTRSAVLSDQTIFGAGIYSPRQAARLIGGSAQEVLRWTRGSGPNDPLWRGHYQFLDDASDLSFIDVIELRVVKALRKAGVSLQAIRFAIDIAENRFKIDRPLATRRFKLLGDEILIDALESDGDLLSLSKKNSGQKVFSEIVRQSLNDLEYEDDYAARWRPSSARYIVIDPKRLFGSPLIDEFGISTRVIFDEYKEFGNARHISNMYEIPLRHVSDAIRFEEALEKVQELDG